VRQSSRWEPCRCEGVRTVQLLGSYSEELRTDAEALHKSWLPTDGHWPVIAAAKSPTPLCALPHRGDRRYPGPAATPHTGGT